MPSGAQPFLLALDAWENHPLCSWTQAIHRKALLRQQLHDSLANPSAEATDMSTMSTSKKVAYAWLAVQHPHGGCDCPTSAPAGLYCSSFEAVQSKLGSMEIGRYPLHEG
jgi:hypothetical protein